MSPRGGRYSLKSSEAKILISKIGTQLPTNLSHFVGAKANIEAVEAGKHELLVIDKKPILFKIGEDIYPTLVFREAVDLLPKAVVDMGAVGHVCNGADIMAPGIVRYEGEFAKGSLIIVVDVKHRKPLALGEVLFASEEAKATKKGVVIKNLHFVGDEVWTTLKTIES